MGKSFDFEGSLKSIDEYPPHRLPQLKSSDPSEYLDNIQSEHVNHSRELERLLDFAQILSSSLEFDAGFLLQHMHELLPLEKAVLLYLKEDDLVPLGIFPEGKAAEANLHSHTLQDPEGFELFWKDIASFSMNAIEEESGVNSFWQGVDAQFLHGVLPDMRSQIWVPLIKHDRLRGCLGFGHSERDFFSDHHKEIAQRISELVANALMNAELFSQSKAAAAMEERRTLARNLHDAVNQSLFSAGLIAEVLPHVWEKDQEEGKRSLEDLRRLTRGAQAEIRMMLVELRPTSLIDVEIADLLHLLASAFAGRTNIQVDEYISKDIVLPPHIRTAYYHFCQEALNNIVKHAKATQVEICFRKEIETISLRIFDNGCGFDRRRKGIKRRSVIDREVTDKNIGFNPKFIPPGHYGFRMMDELAESVGAQLRIDTKPGQGTSISIHWKMAPKVED